MSSQPARDARSHDHDERAAGPSARGSRDREKHEPEHDEADQNEPGRQEGDPRWHSIQPALEQLDKLAAPVKQTVQQNVARASLAVNWLGRFRLYRVGLRFTSRDGNLLAAGMSYRAIFAIFAALWLGFSIAGFRIASNNAFQEAIVGIIDRVVPGLIGPNGAISEAELASLGGALGWTGVIAGIGLLWTATSWLNAVRLSVRVMFDLGSVKVNLVLARLGDVVLALSFGVVLVVAATLSLASTNILTTLLTWIGITSDSFWAEAIAGGASFVVVAALNVLVLAIMFRVLSRVAIPFRALLVGATLGGLSLSVLSTAAGFLIGGASSNPLLASFAVFFGLLLWFNLVCRVILLAASWIAVGMSDRGISPVTFTAEQLERDRARTEYLARLNSAEADVAEAQHEYEKARGLGRIFASRRLTKAHSRLGAIAADRAELAEPPTRLGRGNDRLD
ncbi:YihY/virulence factor BrkB family protein [Rathayibacter soli]|uniref:YihY/virulence factor BrkB family protein n=1 Tax=Rathayibacter soli TaxID=3144168 RepID=UPI0027E514B9|nr:YihY/virulence factor BrkB family protein [Glaciibacter superstes]